MADKSSTITAHVMALSHEKLKKAFSLKNPGDMKRLERWHKRLQELPEDPVYIDKLFEPFYSTEKMPEPADLMAEHWRIVEPKKLLREADMKKASELTWNTVKAAAKTPYAKEVCALVYERWGRPSEEVDRGGRVTRIVIKPERTMTQQEYTDKLMALGVKHNVKWELGL